MDEPACPGCRDALNRIAELEAWVAELTRWLDEAARAAKRQAAPSRRIAADETGWRVGGHSAWLHVWVGDRATGYTIDPKRSADALERVIGRDWSGILSHDGYATYDRFEDAIQQSCLVHCCAVRENC